jgi:hypothetical protein
MFIIILRSICVGIAFVVGAIAISVFVGLPLAMYFLSRNAPAGGGEIGWDLVTMFRNSPMSAPLVPMAIFAVGFLVGFRYFSRSIINR